MWTSSRKRLRRLEAAWHQPAARSHYFPLVARYYDRVQHEPAYQRLPDQTWADLNGDLLFGLLDAPFTQRVVAVAELLVAAPSQRSTRLPTSERCSNGPCARTSSLAYLVSERTRNFCNSHGDALNAPRPKTGAFERA